MDSLTVGLMLSLIPVIGTRVIRDVIVHTDTGAVRGKRMRENYQLGNEAVSNTVDRFFGIPFAAPPVGENRFKPPEPVKAWQGVYNASVPPPVCPQIPIFHNDCALKYQQEDCLYLNVYAPHVPSSHHLLPVMVYVHGGSYEVGSGKLYDGSVLAMYGVVVVTVNYRLGALGFMTSGEEHMAGNYGLLDQVAALQWVQDNIHAFGGNRDKVTLFGHSAGGASVGILMVVPQAKDLFHGVIAQSGSAVAEYGCHGDHDVNFRWYIHKVGQLFKCDNSSMGRMVECIRSQDWRDFVARRVEFPNFDPIDPEFRPYVDGDVLPDYPRKLFEQGKFHKVPIMTGTVKNEFSNYFSGGKRYKPIYDFALDRYVDKYIGPTFSNLVRFEYTNFKETVGNGTLGYIDRGAILSDMHMVAPTVDLATMISHHQPEVYQYLFSTEYSYHSVELNYVFGAPFSGKYADEMTAHGLKNFSASDKRHSILMMTLWSNFAKYGRAAVSASDLGFDWTPFTPKNRTYLHMHSSSNKLRQHLRPSKVAFWNVLIPTLITSSLPTPKAKPANTQVNIAAVKEDKKISADATTYKKNDGPSIWIFIALNVGLAMVVLILSICLLATSVQLKRYKNMLSNFDQRSNILPRHV